LPTETVIDAASKSGFGNTKHTYSGDTYMDTTKVCTDSLEGEFKGSGLDMSLSGTSGTFTFGGISITSGCENEEDSCNAFTLTFVDEGEATACAVISEDGKSLSFDMPWGTYTLEKVVAA
jgi:hypothetical protein